MNGLPYYKAYPRDFMEGTIGMPFELKGAYRLTLDLIYMQGGNLPDDARYISGLLGCSVRAWNGYREKLISAGKLIAENGIISNFRASLEVDNLKMMRDKQRENGSKPKTNKGLTEATAQPRLNHTEPEPEKKEEAKASLPRKRAARLPVDWFLPMDWGEWALAEGMTEGEIRSESEKFKDYWHSRAGATASKLDWHATWRNWVRTAIEGKPTPKGINGGKDDRKQFDAAHREYTRRLAAGEIKRGPDPSDPFAGR